jgi:predicted nucleic acid-binding Zn ribbon protein
MNKTHNCIVCGAVLTGRQTHFCSTTCKNKHHQSYEAQKSRGLTRKLELVQAFGGRCVVCGYNKNLAALTFHHTSDVEKSFKLDVRSLSNRRIEVIRAELEKCILVCQNCHAELHNPHLDLADLVP